MPFRKEILKGWRLGKNLSQVEAARVLSMTQAFYSHLEIGKKSPSLATLEIISNRTKISFSDLVDTINPPQPSPNPPQPSPQRGKPAKGTGAKEVA